MSAFADLVPPRGLNLLVERRDCGSVSHSTNVLSSCCVLSMLLQRAGDVPVGVTCHYVLSVSEESTHPNGIGSRCMWSLCGRMWVLTRA